MASPVLAVAKVSAALIIMTLAIIGTLVVVDVLTVERAMEVAIKSTGILALFGLAFMVVMSLGGRQRDDRKG